MDVYKKQIVNVYNRRSRIAQYKYRIVFLSFYEHYTIFTTYAEPS